MLRILLASLLGLFLAAVVRADDPKPPADPKPPWQRLLTGADAKKAADLRNRIAEAENADRYADAIAAERELLALLTKGQGPDHWETVYHKWTLTALQKVAVLPEPRRLGWRKAAQGAVEAQRLERHAQYADALRLKHQRLTWCQEVLGEDHPETAVSYNNVAGNLNAQGRYPEAGPLYHKALDIWRNALGENHPLTAHGWNNVAGNLKAQGKYAEAGPRFQKALDIWRRAHGEHHANTALGYTNVAGNLDDQGRYTEAGPLYQKALDIWRDVLGEDDLRTATGYNNVAGNLHDQGRYGEAGPLYQKALDVRRRALGEDHPSTATSYNNLAANLEAQGRYAEAGPLHQRALHIRRKALGDHHPHTAQSYNNVASNLNAQRRYAEAGPYYENALDIRRKVLGEDHPLTATSYNNFAYHLNAQGKYAEAEPLYQKALDIRRKVLGEDHPDTALSYNNVAANLQAQGKYAEAGPLFQKALDSWRRALGEHHSLTARGYQNVGYHLHAQERYAEALTLLTRAARSFDGARLRAAAAGLEGAAFGAERSPHRLLAAAQVRAGHPAEAWDALEAGLGRGLLDHLAQRPGLGLTPAVQQEQDQLLTRRAGLQSRVLALVSRPQRNDAEAAELARLLRRRQELEESLGALATRASRRQVATLGQLQAAIPADAALIAWIDIGRESGAVQEHWGCVVRSRGEPRWERLPGTGPGGTWTKGDLYLPWHLREALFGSASASDVAALAEKVHAQRLAPLGRRLDGVRRLFVAPVDDMAGVPVEVLTDHYTVSYTPSATYLARLTDSPRPHTSGVLAVGDPVFPKPEKARLPAVLPPGGLLITAVVPGGAAARARLQPGDVLVSYAGMDLTSADQLDRLISAHARARSVAARVWRPRQDKLAERELPPGPLGIGLAREPAREALIARRQGDELLVRLRRGDAYSELPGTQVEIASLAKLVEARSLKRLTRADASEERLDELRRSGELKTYRYLHLATHGRGNDAVDFESALILTPPRKPAVLRAGEPYLDGRLTVKEVLHYWHLDADLVTLSACESGVGRWSGGEGLLGFAQAFLVAGSRSVCLTLWQVDDTATALLMDRFYRNLLGKREDGGPALPKAEALREAKQWLRNLTAKEALARLGKITDGVVRGERPARQEMRPVPQPKDAPPDYRPYAHPRYWAAFILIGDPQ